VCAVAEKVIWDCLVEEPTLFLRVFLEKLTHRDKQDELIYLLRKLLYFMGSLPAQTAHSLFNYIVGSALYSLSKLTFIRLFGRSLSRIFVQQMMKKQHTCRLKAFTVVFLV